MSNNSIAIKIVSILGGILGSIAFVGFLLLAGLYDSELAQLVFGTLIIITAIWLDKKYNSVLLDTISISGYLIGGLLLGIGLAQLEVPVTVICVVYMLIGISTLNFTQNVALSLVALLCIHGSILGMILINELSELIDLYTPLLAVGTVFVYLCNGWFHSAGARFEKLYLPIRTAITLAFLSCLYLSSTSYLLIGSPVWSLAASVCIIACILYYLQYTLKQLQSEYAGQIKLLVLCAFILLPTLFAPSISGALLILLLGFGFHYRTGLVLGILNTIYFISRFYYDLGLTLLIKSILLIVSGVFFLFFYFLLTRKIIPNEK